MLFNTPSPSVVNSRQKMLAQRMIAKMHGMKHSTGDSGFGTGGAYSPGGFRPGPIRAAGGGGGGAGAPFHGIGAVIRSHMSPGHTQAMGGIPQSILTAMGIGGRGIAGRDFESFPGQGLSGGMVDRNGGYDQGSDQAPDYGQTDPTQAPTAEAPSAFQAAPQDRTPGTTTSSGESIGYTTNTGASGPTYSTSPDIQDSGLTGLIDLGGGRYYDPVTDSIKGGGALSQQTAVRRL